MVTNKSYVGSSINLGHRFSQYYSLAHLKKKEFSIIYRAILKHGYTKFSLDILEYCESSLCISREQYYLDLLKPEYNICKIAGSRLGTKQSEETKIKIGIVQKGMHNHFYEKMHTDETRKKMHLSLKSIVRDNNKSRVATLETKLSMSLRCKGVNVKVYDKSNNLINEFPTITSVAKYFGLSIRTIGYYLDKDKSYNGYIFKSNLSK
jgi:group I intron endonuclease